MDNMLTLREVQLAETNILAKTAKFLDDHNIPYKNKNSNYVGNGAWGYAVHWPAELMAEYTTHEYEGKTFSIPKEYDSLLRATYGDYMQLPPVEKRQGHYIQVSKKVEE